MSTSHMMPFLSKRRLFFAKRKKLNSQSKRHTIILKPGEKAASYAIKTKNIRWQQKNKLTKNRKSLNLKYIPNTSKTHNQTSSLPPKNKYIQKTISTPDCNNSLEQRFKMLTSKNIQLRKDIQAAAEVAGVKQPDHKKTYYVLWYLGNNVSCNFWHCYGQPRTIAKIEKQLQIHFINSKRLRKIFIPNANTFHSEIRSYLLKNGKLQKYCERNGKRNRFGLCNCTTRQLLEVVDTKNAQRTMFNNRQY